MNKKPTKKSYPKWLNIWVDKLSEELNDAYVKLKSYAKKTKNTKPKRKR